MWRSRAVEVGEDVGTLAREGPGMTLVGGGDETNRDLTCRPGLVVYGTGGGGAAAATRVYIAAPVAGEDTGTATGTGVWVEAAVGPVP